jgi:haloalkane dehalogenase
MRGPDGEPRVPEEKVFVENILPASVLRGLSAEARERYRTPVGERGSRGRPERAQACRPLP